MLVVNVANAPYSQRTLNGVTESVWQLGDGVTITRKQRQDAGRLRVNDRVRRVAFGSRFTSGVAGLADGQAFFFEEADEGLLTRLGLAFVKE